MAALNSRQDASGQLVLQSPLLPSLGNIVSSLVWLALLAFFLLPAFGQGRVDWESIAFLGFFFVATAGAGIIGSLISTSVTFDQSGRTLTTSRRLLGFPLASTAGPFSDLASIEYQFYRQRSGRYSHDAWRVDAVAKDGRRIPINWNGKKDEMAALAQTAANKTGADLVDNSVKPVSTVQQILDTIRPSTTSDSESPAPAGSEPAIPDVSTATPPSMPWSTSPGDMQPADQQPSATPAWSDSGTLSEAGLPETVPPMPEAAPAAPPAQTPLRNLSIETLEKRVADDGMDSDARYVLARKYQARNQLDRAMALYQEVLRLDPTNTGAQNDLGVVLHQRGKRTEAEAAYRRAIALDPFSSMAHLNLGLLLRSMNRATDASQEFYQARQNARTDAERRAAEAASTGSKMDPQLSQA